ncbi:MAG TPA: vWA domain-containing protein, partial [Pirellulales bacterium]|nr:vWA domain-containing protein [Pirellulales bacterium]
ASAIEPLSQAAAGEVSDLASPVGFSDSELKGLLATVGETGTGKGAGGEGPAAAKVQPKTKTQFLGSSSSGQRFAFVIDNSGSMKSSGKFDLARTELYRAISMMKPYNYFYVVFYSDRPYPMFEPEVEKDMVAATPANVQKLYQWLAKMETNSGGKAPDAVELCVKLKPDVIYLLTDGKYYGNQVEDISRMCKAAKIPVNTIGLKTEEGIEGLKTIAEKTGGQFLYVP